MSKRKVLAIGIDGVLRDLFGQFDTYYRREFIKNEALVHMDENFNYMEKEDTEEDQANVRNLIDEKINLPLDTYDLLNHYHFESREDLNRFLYVDCAFQIFASAPLLHKTMDSANFLQVFGDSTELFDVVLFAKCKDTSISSTYHFLSKHGCKIRNIKFVDDYDDVWDWADVTISDSPEIFETKPDDKKSIKISYMYNSYSDSDYSFDSLNDIKNEKFIKKLF